MVSMATITVPIPKKLDEVMKKHRNVKWTRVARLAIVKKANELEHEKDPWHEYAMKRWASENDEDEYLFKY